MISKLKLNFDGDTIIRAYYDVATMEVSAALKLWIFNQVCIGLVLYHPIRLSETDENLGRILLKASAEEQRNKLTWLTRLMDSQPIYAKSI